MKTNGCNNGEYIHFLKYINMFRASLCPSSGYKYSKAAWYISRNIYLHHCCIRWSLWFKSPVYQTTLKVQNASVFCCPTANCVMLPLDSTTFFNIAKCRRGQKIHYVRWFPWREFCCDIAATSAVWVRVWSTVSTIWSPILPDLKQPNLWISKTFRPLKMRPLPCLGKSGTN
jgi:hypothetical protein